MEAEFEQEVFPTSAVLMGTHGDPDWTIDHTFSDPISSAANTVNVFDNESRPAMEATDFHAFAFARPSAPFPAWSSCRCTVGTSYA